MIAPKGSLVGEVELPISKSTANRYLIIAALAQLEFPLPCLLPEDVRVLREALSSKSSEINIGMAGTAMRFLTAFYAVQEGKEVVLTGDERMKQRPISELVDALRLLGAEIDYVGRDGFPPLRINGKKIVGGKVEIAASVSSQFISALMMIGPMMENGLQLNLKGKILSKPYIELTRSCMKNCGVNVGFDGTTMSILPAHYASLDVELETDWSAASYFYAFAAAKPNSKLLLKGLKLNSSQGDCILAEWFAKMGIQSLQKGNGVEVLSSEELKFPSELDFTANPDLAQTFAFLAATLGKKLKLTGLDNLRLKETDRISAVQTELEKLGINVEVEGNSLTVSGSISAKLAQIKTYNDHRMAMSASIVSAWACGNDAENTPIIEIEKPKVVEKSFPSFWDQLEKIGFTIDI